MRVLRFIWKWWRGLWQPNGPLGRIDSHKWESKIEILKRLSSKRN